jgi:hypothetical protein
LYRYFKDEATSALDTKTEAGIMDTLGYLMSGRTTILIAHRQACHSLPGVSDLAVYMDHVGCQSIAPCFGCHSQGLSDWLHVDYYTGCHQLNRGLTHNNNVVKGAATPAPGLSTAMHCDQIAVLEAGRIAEQGSHHELLAAGGRYAEMWAAQAHGGGSGVSVGGAEGEDVGAAGDTLKA